MDAWMHYHYCHYGSDAWMITKEGIIFFSLLAYPCLLFSSTGGGHQGAAVCMIGGGVEGVIRFTQVTSSILVIDGTIDGLSPGTIDFIALTIVSLLPLFFSTGLHGLSVNEFGDITQGVLAFDWCFYEKCSRLFEKINSLP